MISKPKIMVKPIAGALGAEVFGLNFDQPLNRQMTMELRDVFLDHLVVFLPPRKLTPNQLVALASNFGEPVHYPQLQGLKDSPYVTAVTKLPEERVNFGGVWHSDTSYAVKPPSATVLYAVDLPPWGGDTLFANQYLAFDHLSPGLQETLEQLTVVNTSTKPAVSRTRTHRLTETGKTTVVLTSEHPAVRIHPDTGRKALYVNEGHTSHFRGWSQSESQPLLDYLFKHQTKPEFTCRFRWQLGAIAIWDNCCTQHLPINDYHGHLRVMHRVTVARN